jgi:hypothetical protein
VRKHRQSPRASYNEEIECEKPHGRGHQIANRFEHLSDQQQLICGRRATPNGCDASDFFSPPHNSNLASPEMPLRLKPSDARARKNV